MIGGERVKSLSLSPVASGRVHRFPDDGRLVGVIRLDLNLEGAGTEAVHGVPELEAPPVGARLRQPARHHHGFPRLGPGDAGRLVECIASCRTNVSLWRKRVLDRIGNEGILKVGRVFYLA